MERNIINNLITKIGEGDELAMEELYNGISKAVFSFIMTYVKNSYSAEDLMQDTFIQIIKHPKKFDDTDNGMAYILTIARNLSLNFIKKEKRQQISTMEEIDLFSGATSGDSEKKVYLSQFLSTLSDEERRILIMKEYYGFTFEEIRKSTKLSIATVKRRMADIKNKFKQFDTKA